VSLEQLQLLDGQDLALVSKQELLVESIWSSQLSTDRHLVDVHGNLPLVAGLGLGFRGRKPVEDEPRGCLGTRIAAAPGEIRCGEQDPPAQAHLLTPLVTMGHHIGARVDQKHRTNPQSQDGLTCAGRALHTGRLGAWMQGGMDSIHGE
jgi:hypothetical protein